MDSNDVKINHFKKFKILLLFVIASMFTLYIKTIPEAEAETQVEYITAFLENSNNADITFINTEPDIIYEQNDETEDLTESDINQEPLNEIQEESELITDIQNEETSEASEVPHVIIDPGHGGEDAGCTIDEILEKDINLDIALMLEDELIKKGYRVTLLRNDDSFYDKYERAEAANKTSGDALISIHQNSFKDINVSGTETWYGGTNELSLSLTKLIHKKVLSSTGSKDRGYGYDDELVITNYTEMPSCLVEIGFMSNPTELLQLNSNDYKHSVAKGIAEGVDLFLKPRVMYLTFDDGPTEHTETILDYLKEKEIKATFFVIGENVKKYPELAQRIVNEGHTIGIHTQSHNYKKIYASTDNFLNDFYEARETIYDITGVRPDLFRFPGGSVNSYNKETCKDIIDEMTKRGFTYFDWNAEVGDNVKNPEYEKIIETARKSTGNKSRAVMLAHDSKIVTANALGDIINLFPEYIMEPITPETKVVQFKIPN